MGPDVRPRACCCRTATRARGPSTRRRASSASSRCAPRTTSRSSTPRPRRSTSTCCAARCAATMRKPLVVFTPEVAAARQGVRARRSTTLTPARSRRCSTIRVGRRDRGAVDRVVFCVGQGRLRRASAQRDERGAPVAIVRVEQLYPWPVRAAGRGAAPATRTPARSCGCRRSPRTWARGTSCRVAPHEALERRGYRSAASVAASSRAARPPASSAIHDAGAERAPGRGVRSTGSRRRLATGAAKPSRAAISSSASRRAPVAASIDLDRGHAHGPGRLEVDAEVVEEDAPRRARRRARSQRQLVEARVGLAHADLARLDDDVEQRHHLVPSRLAVDVPGRRSTKLLVRQRGLRAARGSGARPRPSRVGPRRRAAAMHVARRRPSWPAARASASNSVAELVERHLAALELRPRVGVGVGRVEAADEVRRAGRSRLVRRRTPRTGSTGSRRRSRTARLRSPGQPRSPVRGRPTSRSRAAATRVDPLVVAVEHHAVVLEGQVAC